MTDYSDVSFELKPEFLKVVHFILSKQAALKAGETMLVICDSHTPRHVVDAFVGVGMQLGADAYSLKAPMGPHPALQPGYDWPGLVKAAAAEADLLVDMAIGYAGFLVELAQSGTRIIVPGDATGAPHIEDSLIRCLQIEDPFAVRREAHRVAALMSAGSTMRITSAAGSDFTVDISGLEAATADGFMADPETGELISTYEITPGGMPGFVLPAGGGDGVLAMDGLMLYQQVHNLPRDPVLLTIEKGRVVDVGGDRLVATRLSQWLKSLGEESAYNGPIHANLGLSRMARLTEHLEWERVRGSMVFGFGDNAILAPYLGRNIPVSASTVHWDAQVLMATLEIDGAAICRDGVVAED